MNTEYWQEWPYHSDSTAFCLLGKVEHCWARLVLQWGTTLESLLMFFCFLCFCRLIISAGRSHFFGWLDAVACGSGLFRLIFSLTGEALYSVWPNFTSCHLAKTCPNPPWKKENEGLTCDEHGVLVGTNHSDSTTSRLFSKVMHCQARLVLRWGTTLESLVLFVCFFCFCRLIISAGWSHFFGWLDAVACESGLFG